MRLYLETLIAQSANQGSRFGSRQGQPRFLRLYLSGKDKALISLICSIAGQFNPNLIIYLSIALRGAHNLLHIVMQLMVRQIQYWKKTEKQQ